ncbi:hypothetical protein R5M92_07690 [Halomonas sp. Bachu 37]
MQRACVRHTPFIEWPELPVPLALSDKDQAGAILADAEVYR